MDFLKNLFGGNNNPNDGGYYIYVRPKMCDEIVKVRIDMMNSLSNMDDGDGYFVRKMVSGTRCPFQSEVMLYFDSGKREIGRDIENGEFVTEADYQARYGDEQT